MKVYFRIVENGRDDSWTTLITDANGKCALPKMAAEKEVAIPPDGVITTDLPMLEVEIEDPGNHYATSAGMSFSSGRWPPSLEGGDLGTDDFRLHLPGQKSLDDIVMETGTFVEGALTDRESGAPLAGIRLMLEATNNPYGPAPFRAIPGFTTTTDARGRYRFAVLPGIYRILLPDKEPPSGYAVYEEYPPYVLAQGSVAKGQTANAPAHLTPFRATAGTVSDENGKPIAGVTVGLAPIDPKYRRESDEQFWLETQKTIATVPVSDAAGRWESNRIRPDAADGSGRYRVVVTPGWEVVSPRMVDLPALGVKMPLVAVVVRHSHENLIVGEVRTSDGAPLAGVLLDVYETHSIGHNSSETKGREAITDSAGRYYFQDPADAALIQVQIDARSAVRSITGHSADAFRSAPNAAWQVPPMIATRLSTTLAGLVVDDHNNPVARALVWSGDGDLNSLTETDATGHFTIANLPVGPVSLHAANGTAWLDTTVTTVSPGAKVISPPILTLDRRPPLAASDYARLRGDCIDSLMASVAADTPNALKIRRALAQYAPERVLTASTRFGYDDDGSVTRIEALLELVRRNPADAATAQRCLAAIDKSANGFRRASFLARLGCRICHVQPAQATQLYDRAHAEALAENNAVQATAVALFELATLLQRTADLPTYTAYFQTLATTSPIIATVLLPPATEDGDLADVAVVNALIQGLPPIQRALHYRRLATECEYEHPETARAYRQELKTLPALSGEAIDVGASSGLSAANDAREQAEKIVAPERQSSRSDYSRDYLPLCQLAENALPSSPSIAHKIWGYARADFLTPTSNPTMREIRFSQDGPFLWRAADLDPAFTLAITDVGFHWSAGRAMNIQVVAGSAAQYAVVLGKVDPDRALALLDELTRLIIASKNIYAIESVISARISLLHYFSLPPDERRQIDFDSILSVRSN